MLLTKQTHDGQHVSISDSVSVAHLKQNLHKSCRSCSLLVTSRISAEAEEIWYKNFLKTNLMNE